MRGSRVHCSGKAVSAPSATSTRQEVSPWTLPSPRTPLQTSVSPARAWPPARVPSRTSAALSVDRCRVASVHPHARSHGRRLKAPLSRRAPPWTSVTPHTGESVPQRTLPFRRRRTRCLSAAKGSPAPPHPRAPPRTSSALFECPPRAPCRSACARPQKLTAAAPPRPHRARPRGRPSGCPRTAAGSPARPSHACPSRKHCRPARAPLRASAASARQQGRRRSRPPASPLRTHVTVSSLTVAHASCLMPQARQPTSLPRAHRTPHTAGGSFFFGSVTFRGGKT